MSRPDQNDARIEAILDDLYANELNVSISWDHPRGFHAALGNPLLAEKWFPTGAADAVHWLKDQAIRLFPRAEFRPAPDPDSAQTEQILDLLCASNIAGSISYTWDGGFHATLGKPKVAENGQPAARAKLLRGCAIRRSCITPAASLPAVMSASATLP